MLDSWAVRCLLVWYFIFGTLYDIWYSQLLLKILQKKSSIHFQQSKFSQWSVDACCNVFTTFCSFIVSFQFFLWGLCSRLIETTDPAGLQCCNERALNCKVRSLGSHLVSLSLYFLTGKWEIVVTVLKGCCEYEVTWSITHENPWKTTLQV